MSHDSPFAIVTELAVFGYFFAVRSCKNMSTPKPGCTKISTLSGMTFHNATRQVIPHTHPGLAAATYITHTFVAQKNPVKMDTQMQQRTNNTTLCPVNHSASLVQQILLQLPDPSRSTTINTALLNGRVMQITGAYIQTQLWATCHTYGRKAQFGFDTNEIVTKSILSGAAMALFLRNHLTGRIMIMGRWLTCAFLVYIHPQVLGWTNNMSANMTCTNHFFEVGTFDRANPNIPRLCPNRFNSLDDFFILPMHLHH